MTKVITSYSVSHGTMRSEDLIPSFVSELEDRQNENQYTQDGDEAECVARNTRHTDLLAGIESRMLDSEGETIAEYFDSEDVMHDLEALFDALDEYAGDGFTFGAHEGDGCDYGYWPCDSEDDDSEDDETEPTCEQCQAAMLNSTLCHEHGCPNANKRWDAERGEWIAYFECSECGYEVESGNTCDCQDDSEDDEAEDEDDESMPCSACGETYNRCIHSI